MEMDWSTAGRLTVEIDRGTNVFSEITSLFTVSGVCVLDLSNLNGIKNTVVIALGKRRILFHIQMDRQGFY